MAEQDAADVDLLRRLVDGWVAKPPPGRGEAYEALNRLGRAGTDGAVDLIRSLGFVGNMHYCPDCMRHFHDYLGQHAPGCELIKRLIAELGEDEDG